MRKLFLFWVFFFSLSVVVIAQEVPRLEIFGGYSHFQAPSGSFSRQIGGTSASILDKANVNGWEASVTGNASRWLGIEGDFGGYYGRVTTQVVIFHVTPSGVTSTPFNDTAKVRYHSYLLGPRLSYRSDERFTPFVHALFGGIRQTLDGPQISTGGAQTSFGMALGGGLDIKVAEHVALRVVQADYVRTRFGFKAENDLRLSFGAVFRF
ncbi:MAG: outer membrane protein [Terriglobia bacterium]